MSDRSVRSLLDLQANASTSRTLNLIAVWTKHGQEPSYNAKPFFDSQVLNRSIIVKHRLRQHELDDVPHGRSSATKVILPIDVTDLRLGARSFFVGQKSYADILDELGIKAGDRDAKLLGLLDELPSLDPFLTREHIQRAGFIPDRCFFELTEADLKRMFDFVRTELVPLIGMSFDEMDARVNEKTAKLASKILDNVGDAELDPLRVGMGMAKPEFEEGMFCWKGFIYYKWTLTDLLPKVRPVADEIAKLSPWGAVSEDERFYIYGARAALSKAIGRACETVRATLKVYDDAYADLTLNGKPQSFRDFLLKAPGLFYELGERLGAIQHIVSFWRFRFPPGAVKRIPAEELVDLLVDFESSLRFEEQSAQAAA